MSRTKRTKGNFSLAFSWKDMRFPTIVLVALNVIDAILTLYAVTTLGFIELNPFAVGFPAWIFVLKFGVCLIPVICAYVLDKAGMQNYMLLPFVFSVVLVEFYSFVVVSGVRNIFVA